jgi:hypothetical protein
LKATSTVTAGAQDSKPAVFFHEVCQAFEIAKELAGGAIDRFYKIGGFVVRLRFAGPALVSLVTPALEHLRTKPNPVPALTICLWDSASTGTEMPPAPWNADDHVVRGEIWGFNNERFNTVFQADVSILNMLDSERNLAIYWVRDCRLFRYYETASPLRTLLYWWMRRHGRQMVHAAAIGNSHGGVLITGKGGCGKSTTSLVCLDAGLLYAGDNYVLVSQESTAFAYSLYNSSALHVANLHRRFPHLASQVSNPERLDAEKALLFLHEYYPQSVTDRMCIKAILLPQVTGRRTSRVSVISPAQSLVSLAPSSIFLLPDAGPQDFQAMARLVRQVPSYLLELGTDVSQIAETIIDLLSD